jgi:hypothetical protein
MLVLDCKRTQHTQHTVVTATVSDVADQDLRPDEGTHLLGLWSTERCLACPPFCTNIALESPAFATNIFLSCITAATAVVPSLSMR